MYKGNKIYNNKKETKTVLNEWKNFLNESDVNKYDHLKPIGNVYTKKGKVPFLSSEDEYKMTHEIARLIELWGETNFIPSYETREDEAGRRYKIKTTDLSPEHKRIAADAQRLADQLLTRGPKYTGDNYDDLVKDIYRILKYGHNEDYYVSRDDVTNVIKSLNDPTNPTKWYGVDPEKAKEIRQSEIDHDINKKGILSMDNRIKNTEEYTDNYDELPDFLNTFYNKEKWNRDQIEYDKIMSDLINKEDEDDPNIIRLGKR